MNAFELNKIFCAILATIFVVMSLSFLSESLFHVDKPEKSGFEIAVLDEAAESTDAATQVAAPLFEPIEALLASADVDAGKKAFRRCSGCHNVTKGGDNGTGPALYGIIGSNIAAVGDYGYSSALTEYGQDKVWTFEEMNGFIWKPKTYVKGTAMGFAGLKKVQDRANLIKYLNAQSDSPLELPGS